MRLPAILNSPESRPDLSRALEGLFTPKEIRTHLARIEREQNAYDADSDNEGVDELDDDDEFIRESPAAAAERARQFATIKELLTAAELCTS